MRGREDTSDYASLFLGDAPLLDTRAPLEFARGAFPGAQNLPLMSDDERAAVGTCYKQQGQDAALALGHQLVAGELREQRILAWQRFARDNPDGYLYCFRGGLRSQLVQQWLRESGVDYPRISGGYKAMRRFLIDTLEARIQADRFILVAGATGTGKTRLIQELPRAIDLEGLARHRGSAFGRLLEEQPTQIDFENALAIALLKLAQQPGPVLLEDEGRLIGRLALPDSLRERMAAAPLVLLEYPLEQRVDVVLEDYILDLGARFARAHGSEGPLLHRERLLGDLARTRKRLGGARHQEIAALMEFAFAEQGRSGDPQAHREWIRRLLADYYDPMYEYQLSQREGQRLQVGDRQALRDFIVGSINAG
jgi:tRNA 2-selenouridine synthase